MSPSFANSVNISLTYRGENADECGINTKFGNAVLFGLIPPSFRPRLCPCQISELSPLQTSRYAPAILCPLSAASNAASSMEFPRPTLITTHLFGSQLNFFASNRLSVPYNVGSSYRVGGTAFITYRPNGFLNVRLYTNVFDYGYRMDRGDKGIQQAHKVSWSTRLNCWVKLWNKYQVFASANYSSPTISLAAERKARYAINCGVRADFFKRKLSAFVNVQDIFNWGEKRGSGSFNTDPYLLSESSSYTINSRYISAGITLRFGKMELENRSKEGSEESDSPSM